MPEHNKSFSVRDIIEKGILGITILAGVVLLAKPFLPAQANIWLNSLIPIFIAAVCVQIYFIRTDIKHVRDNIDNYKFSFQSFASGEDFDNYLANRFKAAEEVKVIHLSSGSSSEGERRRYSKILGAFVKRGGKFTRIISDTRKIEVFKWIKEDLKEYEKHNYFIHFVTDIMVGEIRTVGIMIIDKDEVCLGGGYGASYKHPTISITHEGIVRFFLDYFEYLSYKSLHVRTDKHIKWEFLDKRIEELEKQSSSLS